MIGILQPFHLLVIALTGWLSRQQQTVIDHLLEKNRVLKGQLKGQRLRFTAEQRIRLAVKGKLIAQKWTFDRRGPGRPRLAQEITDLELRMTRENTSWGYDRKQGALANLGHIIAPNTVENILKSMA